MLLAINCCLFVCVVCVVDVNIGIWPIKRLKKWTEWLIGQWALRPRTKWQYLELRHLGYSQLSANVGGAKLCVSGENMKWQSRRRFVLSRWRKSKWWICIYKCKILIIIAWRSMSHLHFGCFIRRIWLVAIRFRMVITFLTSLFLIIEFKFSSISYLIFLSTQNLSQISFFFQNLNS